MTIFSETTVGIPVSYVESGRWSYSKKNFKSSETILTQQVPCCNAGRHYQQLRYSGTFQSDSGAVWRAVDDTLRECGVRSETSAYDAAPEHVSPGIEQYVAAFHLAERQIGGIYFGASGIPLGVACRHPASGDISFCGGCGGLEALSINFYMTNIYVLPKLFFVKNHPHPPHHPQQNKIKDL